MSDLVNATDEFVQELLDCKKYIKSNPSPREKTNGAHKETGITVATSDERFRFQVFVRQHLELMENFSIGLVYYPDGGIPYVVTRYNGQHGRHKNFLTGEVFEDECHIHILKEEVKNAGIRYDNHAEATNKYSTIEEAMLAFFKDLKFQNHLKFFPELSQPQMSF